VYLIRLKDVTTNLTIIHVTLHSLQRTVDVASFISYNNVTCTRQV